MHRSMGIWLICGIVCLFAAPSIAAQAPASQLDIVNVVLETNIVKVRTLQAVQVDVRLRDAEGRLRARATEVVSPAGIQDIRLYTASGTPAIIEPGDSILVTPEGGTPTSIETVFLDARPVAETDTIRAEGPPDASLTFQIKTPDSPLQREFTATTDGSGAAVLNLAGIMDLRPGASGYAAYELGDGRAVLASFLVPTVVVKVGSDWIEGIAWAGWEVAITVEDEAGRVVATTRLLAGGEPCFRGVIGDDFPKAACFSTRLAEQFAGQRIHPGDTIHVAWADQQITLAVPQLSIRADPQADRITGRGPASAKLSISLFNRASGRRHRYQPTADPSGQYLVDLAGLVDINPNDDGSVIYETPGGHQLVAEFRVPLIELEVGSHRIRGRGVENAGVSVTLRAGDGTTRATGQTVVDMSGNFALELETGGEPVPVTAGDVVEVTVGDEYIAVDVPALAVRLDADQDRVTGEGPPGQPLRISLVAGDDRFTEEVTPDQAGHYAVDFRNRTDIRAGAQATAEYATPGEHAVSAQDRLAQVTVQAGSNHVEGVGQPDSEVDVTIRDADGRLKDRARVAVSSRGRFTTNAAVDCRTPVIIESGDEIVLTTGAEELRLVIPELTATLDAASDQVHGSAPAGASIEVRLYAAGRTVQDAITVGADGFYSLTYAPDVDVRPGDYATVTFANPDGHAIWVRSNVPQFSGTIGQANVGGTVGPLEAMTITLRDGAGTPKAQATARGSSSGSFSVELQSDAGQPVPVEAGDRLEVATSTKRHTVSVPPLSLAVDPAGPAISGITVPNTTVEVFFVSQSGGFIQREITAGADGYYTTAFEPDIAVRASDWVTVRITTPDGFRAAAVWSAPHLTAYVGTHYVKLGMTPASPVAVTLQNSAGMLRATGRPDPVGDGGHVFTTDGVPVIIRPGDRVVVEQAGGGQVAAMTVPELTLNLVPESGALRGTAPASTEVFISVRGTGGEDARNEVVPVWADGTFQVRFAGLDLGPGASASASYTDAETFQRTIRQTYRGWFRAHADTNSVDVLAEPLAEVMLHLRAKAGTVKGQAGPVQVDQLGRATLELRAADGTPALIRAGDQIELEAPEGATRLTVPDVRLGVDVAGSRVFGSLPEPGPTSVRLVTSDGCIYERQARPAPDGNFTVDFEYDTRIGVGDEITLQVTTSAGHGLELGRTIRGVHLPLIIHD